MSTYLNIIVIGLSLLVAILIYVFLPLSKSKLFDKYFEIYLDENYNLNSLFPIKIEGQIKPKVNFLEIPYENLNIEINTKTIRGSINNNNISLELIKPSDRKTAVSLIKENYMKTVKPYVNETLKNKKEHIDLIKISEKQKNNMKKIACKTCKHKMQCKISFNKCNYERDNKDEILQKGIVVKTNKNYEINGRFE